MEIEGGQLNFSAGLDTSGMEKGVNKSVQLAKQLASSMSDAGNKTAQAYQAMKAKVQASFNDLDKAADENKTALNGLKEKYEQIGKSAAAAFKKGTAAGDDEYRSLKSQQAVVKQQMDERQKMLDVISQTADELQQAEAAWEKEAKVVDENDKAHSSLRQQIREMTLQLVEMEAAGKRGTPEYDAMRQSVAELSDAFADAKDQVRFLADDNAGINGVIQGISGVSGAFSAAQGVMGLFTTESENLNKVMLKVQSVMAITNGLQAVATTLNKDSVFSLTALTKAKTLFAAASTKMSAGLQKLGISATTANVAAKALTATLTMGLSIAITAAIVLLEKFKDRQEKMREEQEAFSKAVTESASKPVASIMELSAKYTALGSNMKAKEEFIKANKDAFKELGVEVNGVAEAENLLIENKDKFVSAQIAKAKAVAVAEQAQEKVKELLQKEQEIDATPEKVAETVTTYSPTVGNITQYTGRQIDNPVLVRLRNEKAEIEKEIESLYADVADYESEASDTLKGANITASADGATEAIKTFSEGLAEVKTQYEEFDTLVNSSDKAARNSARTQYASLLENGNTYLEYLQNQRKEIMSKIAAGDTGKELRDNLNTLNLEITREQADSVQKALEEKVKQYTENLSEQVSNAKSLEEKLNILSRERTSLESSGVNTEEARRKLSAIEEQEKQVNTELESIAQEALDNYNNYLGKRLTAATNYQNTITALNKRKEQATTKEEKEQIDKLIEETTNLYNAGIDSFDDYLSLVEEGVQKYGTFEQKRLNITQRYEKLIAAARVSGNEDVAKKLEGEQELEVLELTSQYSTIFSNITKSTSSAILSAKKYITQYLQDLVNQGKITSDKMQEYVDKMDEEIRKTLDDGSDTITESLKTWTNVANGNSTAGGLLNMLFGSDDFATKIKQSMASVKTMDSATQQLKSGLDGAAGGMTDAASSAVDGFSAVSAVIKAILDMMAAASVYLNGWADLIESEGASDKYVDNVRQVSDMIGNLSSGLSSAMSSLKSGDAFGFVTGVVSAAMQLESAINKFADNKIQQEMDDLNTEIKALNASIEQTKWEMDRTFGSTNQYAKTKEIIKDYEDEIVKTQQLIDDEREKKDSDRDYITEMEENIQSYQQAIVETIEDMKEDILTTTVSDFASQIATSIVENFASGIEATQSSVKEAVDSMIKNIIINAVATKFIEEPLEEAFNQLYESITGAASSSTDEIMAQSLKDLKDKVKAESQSRSVITSSTRTSDSTTSTRSSTSSVAKAAEGAEQAVANDLNITEEAINEFRDNVSSITELGVSALDQLSGALDGILDSAEDTDLTSLSGAIKGASQESIDLLAGQTNAVRINQVTEIEIMRNQLSALAEMNSTTSAIKGITQNIYNIMNGTGSADSELRAQGL